MKTSEILFETTKEKWEIATEKPFVRKMADGTLEADSFRQYMLQDYFYLQDYIEILGMILAKAEDRFLRDFLSRVIETTKGELDMVHVPNMKRLGITSVEIRSCVRAPENLAYTGYLRKVVESGGVMHGLTAMLHCSWMYAYIALKMKERFPEEIERSAYNSWFEAYSCEEYVDSNREWIDILDMKTIGIGEAETEKLCHIFKTCADYENNFWDIF